MEAKILPSMGGLGGWRKVQSPGLVPKSYISNFFCSFFGGRGVGEVIYVDYHYDIYC